MLRSCGSPQRLFWGAGWLALWRMAAIMAKASMTSETWRCGRPGAGLVVIETESPRRLQAVLDGPALSFHSNQPQLWIAAISCAVSEMEGLPGLNA